MALTLRTLGGLTTAEIARAFLIAESRRWPSASSAPSERSATPRSPTRCPPREHCPSAAPAVLATLYLVFNEGYAATAADELVRRELCAEAIRLGRRFSTR